MKRLSLALAASLLLPVAAVADEPPATPPQVHFVSAAQWGSDPDPIPEDRRHTPRRVTIHHAAVKWSADRDPIVFLRNLQTWGKRRPEIEPPPRNTYWPDLPYHFLIAPDGRVFEGRPLDYQPESNTRYELAGHLGVELMGNFDEQRPSLAQLDAATRTVAWLLDRYDLPLNAVGTHAQAAPGQTACPGRDVARYFEGEKPAFHEWVARVRRGEAPAIDPGPPLDGGPTAPIPLPRP